MGQRAMRVPIDGQVERFSIGMGDLAAERDGMVLLRCVEPEVRDVPYTHSEDSSWPGAEPARRMAKEVCPTPQLYRLLGRSPPWPGMIRIMEFGDAPIDLERYAAAERAVFSREDSSL
jgi:hypothetical protein